MFQCWGRVMSISRYSPIVFWRRSIHSPKFEVSNNRSRPRDRSPGDYLANISRGRNFAEICGADLASENLPGNTLGKRIFDIVLTLLAAPSAILIVVLAAIAICATSGGPILFTQDRVGLRGRLFRIYKLRTMAPRGPNSNPTLRDDPRVTPIGAILRKYRIDELPQLVNVLLGEMSLIGPRPEQPHLAELYSRCIPQFNERHRVKPGITGLAQVKYHYAADVRETRNKVRYDRVYVRRISFGLDLWILTRTITVVLGGFGAR
jgi:lipopolysaccharide/colanic/teichoic acid biosynthesis glycosyltransferase